MQKMRWMDLDLANRLQNTEDKEVLLEELGIQQEKRKVAEATRASKQAVAVLEKPVKTVREDVQVYIPKDLRRHVLKDYSVAHLHPYVNMRTLIGHHLGLKGYSEKLLVQKDERATALHELVTGFLTSGILKPQRDVSIFPCSIRWR